MFRGAAATKQFSRATKPFPAFGADVRKQRMVINSPTKRRSVGTTPKPEPARCGPSASFLPAPLSWLALRWPVRRIMVRPASVPSPIRVRRSQVRLPRLSWLPPAEAQSSQIKKVAGKGHHASSNLFRGYCRFLHSGRLGAGSGSGCSSRAIPDVAGSGLANSNPADQASADSIAVVVQAARSSRRIRASVRAPYAGTLGAP